ncbi:MAG TPA: methyltransferase domain-containing protein [Chloroflexota bacterium]|nr:methyltransferase domain-containing protein [Chloroflexota bacterium]
MSPTQVADTRKTAERTHGRAIAGRAARVWGQYGRAGQERVARRARLIAESAGLRPGVRALELGCGTGEYTERLVAAGASLSALDLVPELVAVARRRPGLAGVAWLLGDAEQLPLPDGALDAVVGNAVLHHLRLGPALAEIVRVLRPGGRCALTEPNMLNPQVAVQKNVPTVKRWLGDTPHETAFLSWRIRAALVHAGLVVERITPFDFLHPVIPDSAVPLVQSVESSLERAPLVSHLAGSLLIVARRP